MLMERHMQSPGSWAATRGSTKRSARAHLAMVDLELRNLAKCSGLRSVGFWIRIEGVFGLAVCGGVGIPVRDASRGLVLCHQIDENVGGGRTWVLR
jgi:hypothetical protein